MLVFEFSHLALHPSRAPPPVPSPPLPHLPPPPAGCCVVWRGAVTAVRRGWVSHSFPRLVIAGKGCTLSVSQQGNHGRSHARRHKSCRALGNYPSTTTFSRHSRNIDLHPCVAPDYFLTPNSNLLLCIPAVPLSFIQVKHDLECLDKTRQSGVFSRFLKNEVQINIAQ